MRRIYLSVMLAGCLFVQVPRAFTQAKDTNERPKAKHVFTSDDIEELKSKGGVSVVGDTTKPPTNGENGPADVPSRENSRQCESDAWAAAVAGIVRQQGGSLSPRFWADKLFGGCSGQVQLGAVATRINGDYTLDDGRKLAIKAAAFAPGLPAAAAVVAAIGAGRPFLVVWKKRPFVAANVDFIDRPYIDGGHVYTIAKLTLIEPLTSRTVIWDATTDSMADIDGSLQVEVTARK